MRKKSHISLARYIVNSLDDKELKKHRFSFYIGSVLPDIKPSFIYKRHEINGTFPYVKKHIARLSEGQKVMNKKNRKYYRDLGQVSHYLADYFTFPHNKIYPGGFKDHCSYEERLKRDLRSYIKSGEAERQHISGGHFVDAKALCDYIQKAHDDYIERKHDVADDITHIVEVNRRAIEGMIEVLAGTAGLQHDLCHRGNDGCRFSDPSGDRAESGTSECRRILFPCTVMGIDCWSAFYVCRNIFPG